MVRNWARAILAGSGEAKYAFAHHCHLLVLLLRLFAADWVSAL
jgi:hypothetical protein